MSAFLLSPRVRHAALLLGLSLSACRSEDPPPPEEEAPPARARVAIQGVLPIPNGVPTEGGARILEGHPEGLLVFRGNGDGTFDDAELQVASEHWSPSAVGDVVQDVGRRQDLVSTNINELRQRILASDDVGRFSPRAELELVRSHRAITLADVDVDGRLDVLTVQNTFGFFNGPSLLTVWRTGFTTSHSVRVDLSTASEAPMAVAAANLDGDEYPELLVASGRGVALEVFNVKGFSGPATVRTQVPVEGCAPVALATADLDGDADTDVVLSCKGLVILRNDGRGNLGVAQRLPSPGGITHTVLTVDFELDGRLELVVDDYKHGATLYTRAADGSFQYRSAWAINFRETRTVDFTPERQGLFIADFNRDGRPDLMSGMGYTGTASLALGDGRGGFSGPELKRLEPGGPVHAFGDLNGDGAPDIVSKNHFFINGPGGTFQGFPTPFDGTNRLTTVFDVNDDGKGDVVSIFAGQAELWLSTGQTLVYQSSMRYALGPPSGKRDVDHDGVPDLLIGGGFARGLGEGRFGENVQPYPTRFEHELTGGALDDHNGDGELDAYTSNYSIRQCQSGGRCELHPQGPGLFLWDKGSKRYELFRVPPPLRAQRVLDHDGDGRPDLLTTEQIARGRGDGTFEWPEPLPAMSTQERMRLGLRFVPYSADVDGDGRTDILEFFGDWLEVKLGTEDGEFATPVRAYTPGFHPNTSEAMRLFDVDDDGLPELVRPTAQGIAVLKLATW